MARVAIVGSRRRTDRHSVVDLVNSLPEGTVVVSGGCVGVDTWAAEAARARGLEVKEHLPNIAGKSGWDKVNAYYARNEQIVLDSSVVCALPAPDRRGGTENTLKHARRHKVPFFLY